MAVVFGGSFEATTKGWEPGLHSEKYVNLNHTSTARVRRLRERRARGIVMCARVEVGDGGMELLRRNGLLEAQKQGNREAVEKAVHAALEQWAVGQGARITAL